MRAHIVGRTNREGRGVAHEPMPEDEEELFLAFMEDSPNTGEYLDNSLCGRTLREFLDASEYSVQLSGFCKGCINLIHEAALAAIAFAEKFMEDEVFLGELQVALEKEFGTTADSAQAAYDLIKQKDQDA